MKQERGNLSQVYSARRFGRKLKRFYQLLMLSRKFK